MEKGLPEHLMYKNHLQEYTQRNGLPFPSYHTENEGYQHAPKFRSSVLVNGETYMSQTAFVHKKEAEQDAARFALQCIKDNMEENGHSILDKDTKHCKSILQEYAVRMNLRAPKYRTIQQDEQRPIFISSLLFDGQTYFGQVCPSKKQAEQTAAQVAIQTLVTGAGSGVLQKIINSKSKMCTKVKTSTFKQSNQSVVRKSVESYVQHINQSSMDQAFSGLENKVVNSGEENLQNHGQ